jgi:hypothetical protein
MSEGAMKFIILFILMVGFHVKGQSLHDKKIKEQMLSRTDDLIVKLEECSFALEREEVSLACKKINQIFKILPDHLISIGTRMNMFNPQVVKMENQTRAFLIFIHQQTNICKRGETGEYLDIPEVIKRFKSANKMLDKQRGDIKKLDTDFENAYNYYYEFY